jgi:hypothetical protein
MTNATQARVAAAAAALRSNIPAPKSAAPIVAKVKAPTKAEQERAQDNRHLVLATKTAEKTDFASLAAGFVSSYGSAAANCRALAAALNAEFADDMAAHKMHWKFIHASDTAKAAGSNLRPLWERIEARRMEVQELAIKNDKISHKSRNKPWSDIMAAAIAMTGYATRVEGKTLSTSDKIKADLLKAYKAIQKDMLATETDCNIGDTIGKILMTVYKVDLTKYNG